MQALRQQNLLNIVRTLVLTILIGQSALLLHELGHGPHPADNDCEICLHIPSGSPANNTAVSARLDISYFQTLTPLSDQPSWQQPVYTQPPRGPPLV